MSRIAFAVCAFLAAAPAFATALPQWMAGSWRIDTPDARVEEHWTVPGGGMMLGMGRTVTAKGKTSFEFLRIAEVDGRLAYLAQPQGKPATAFPLQSATESRIVFENPGHDFPQRILYWRDGAKLCARTEGKVRGKDEAEQWCYSPAD
ncbi:MAG TPA: DUF6265 family protein [Thermoanaerobaculia bacterium]|jgi:hypothetical protein